MCERPNRLSHPGRGCETLLLGAVVEPGTEEIVVAPTPPVRRAIRAGVEALRVELGAREPTSPLLWPETSVRTDVATEAERSRRGLGVGVLDRPREASTTLLFRPFAVSRIDRRPRSSSSSLTLGRAADDEVVETDPAREAALPSSGVIELARDALTTAILGWPSPSELLGEMTGVLAPECSSLCSSASTCWATTGPGRRLASAASASLLDDRLPTVCPSELQPLSFFPSPSLVPLVPVVAPLSRTSAHLAVPSPPFPPFPSPPWPTPPPRGSNGSLAPKAIASYRSLLCIRLSISVKNPSASSLSPPAVFPPTESRCNSGIAIGMRSVTPCTLSS